MDRKQFSRFSILFVVTIFTVSLFLTINGCCIFGGKGKKAEEMPPQKPAEKAVSKAETPKPLPAAETSDEIEFKTDSSDDEVKVLNGSLNWSKGFIRATGYGIASDKAVNTQQAKLLAFRAAYADALANLLEITVGVNVNAKTTVKDYMVKDHTVEISVNGLVKGAKEISRDYNDKDKTAVVEVGIAMEDVAMSIPKDTFAPTDASAALSALSSKEDATLEEIAGDDPQLKEAIESSENLDEVKQKLEKISKDNENLGDKNEQLLAKIDRLAVEIESLKSIGTPQADYTGVVVNAASSGIKPCMAPDIYYPAGDGYKLLYGINDGRPRDESLHALVVWEQTLSDATSNKRVTQTPFVVNATHMSEELSALAISADDAAMIERIDKENALLEKGAVVVVR